MVLTQGQIPLPPLFNEAKNVVVDELHRRLEERGFGDIRSVHGCVFRFVPEDGMRLTTLADQAGLTKQAVGEIVDELQVAGYVDRLPDPADKRAKLIHLTPHGKACQAAALEIFLEIEAEWAERFGQERVAAMREVLEGIVLGGQAKLAA